MYRYGAGGGFPTSSYNATNYWADVLFASAADTTPPAVAAKTPAAGATGVTAAAAVTATFGESIQPGTLVFSQNPSQA